MEITGMTQKAVYAGAEAAEDRGLIKRRTDRGVTEWAIIWNDPPDIGVDSVSLEDTPAYPSEGHPVSTEDTPSIKESSKESSKEKENTPEQKHRERIKTILRKQGLNVDGDILDLYASAGNLSQASIDVTHYPEEVRYHIERFARLWRIPPPAKTDKSEKGDWIKSGRSLLQASFEYGPALLDLVYYGLDWIDKDGEPLTISRPGAVVKWTRAKAAILRQRGVKPEGLPEQIEIARHDFMIKAPSWLIEQHGGTAEDQAQAEIEFWREHGG